MFLMENKLVIDMGHTTSYGLELQLSMESYFLWAQLNIQ
jgi:hypothetical protein